MPQRRRPRSGYDGQRNTSRSCCASNLIAAEARGEGETDDRLDRDDSEDDQRVDCGARSSGLTISPRVADRERNR
jgi:hypothetical protein